MGLWDAPAGLEARGRQRAARSAGLALEQGGAAPSPLVVVRAAAGNLLWRPVAVLVPKAGRMMPGSVMVAIFRLGGDGGSGVGMGDPRAATRQAAVMPCSRDVAFLQNGFRLVMTGLMVMDFGLG